LNGNNFNNNFNNNFDPFSMFNRQHQQQHNEEQIKQIKLQVNVTLEEIFSGKNICETIQRRNPCNECECTGFTDKKNHTCTNCNGNGKTVQMIRMGPQIAQMVVPCNSCNGKGTSGNALNKCKKCLGGKSILENYQLKYKLEKGVMKEDYIPILGEGHHGIINGKNKRGDIVLFMNIKEHTIFKISNTYDLMMNMELTLVEALCGTVKSFKFLNGENVFFDIIDPIYNGDTKMLNEYGLPHMNSTYKVGNLHIKFTVKYPETEEYKKNIYFALTGNIYDYDKLHEISENCNALVLHDIVSDNENSSDENFNQNPGGVQCAQQ
jgi:DnaJ family protein A protein 2